MVTTIAAPKESLPKTPARRLRLAHWLAALGIPILFWELWTVTAWLADGPHQITEYRNGRTVDWYAARVFEGLMILVAIAVLIEVIRGCRREHRILTFDVMFCMCGATLFWADAGANFFQPVFTNSSNWVNLNNTCGHMPFVVNPDCGRVPDPLLFLLPMEIFGILGATMLLGAVVRRARRRWPRMTTPQVLGVLLLSGMALAAFEPLAIALNLWSYGGAPLALPVGKGMTYPLFPELIGFGAWFAMVASVRIFRNDRGERFVERGLEHHSPRVRKAITLLALYTFLQLAIWGPATAPLFPLGIYAKQWPKMPAHVANGLCDMPGLEGTAYGPCPGTAKYRMPGRQSQTSGKSE